jgi:hypothetical protein
MNQTYESVRSQLGLHVAILLQLFQLRVGVAFFDVIAVCLPFTLLTCLDLRGPVSSSIRRNPSPFLRIGLLSSRDYFRFPID